MKVRAIRLVWAIGLFLFLFFSLGRSQPAWGAIAQPDRIPLTLELLQDRVRNPIQIEGIRTIDLRRFIIDLRPDNSSFRDQFYRLLQTPLRRAGSPLGLDLSYSLIVGELKISDLGLRAPLYGETLSPIFSEAEQEQLKRDRRRLSQFSQLSRSLLIQSQPVPLQITVFRGSLSLIQTRFEGFVNLANTFFLGRLNAEGADFVQDADWTETRFSQTANFLGARFRREARFRSSIYFDRAKYNQVDFQGNAIFQNSEFQSSANFSQATFQQLTNFSRVQWEGDADFAQTRWQGQVLFDRDRFERSLFLTETHFEKTVSFRETQFNQPINLRNARLQEQLDLGDANFAPKAYLNISGLQFNPEQAKIIGDPGRIATVLSVPTLQGNETLLRNLVRNFRLLEQIPDVNAIEYLREKLRLRDLRQRLFATNLNTASVAQLQQIGFSAKQANAIAQFRQNQSFHTISDLLKLDTIDLATYVKVRDRVIAARPRSITGWLGDALHWIGLNLLLSFSRYGTSFWLIFGVGMVSIPYFALLFWLVDRVRRRFPKPILPTTSETLWIWSFSGVLTLSGLTAIFRTSDRPFITLASLGFVTIPVSIGLLALLYLRGRYHDLMTVSYFTEEGSLRQLRFLIGRLPIIPRFPLFRERYVPLLWDRRWNWLNYLDFSLNNWLRFGFNDIRLRDEHLPGLISTLAWYQWLLGLLYFAILLWTLSRTIPGLNLLIYFK